MRVELRTCACAVYVECARCRGRREAPSGEACGSSRRGELRGRVGLSRTLQRSVNRWSQQTRQRG
ncbi:hypothetical protein BGY98DRAFT_983960, partial [Russula aff. rugulosa BPL654]